MKDIKKYSLSDLGLDNINHPEHYGGAENPYEAIKIIEALELDKCFYLGDVCKYIFRAGKKDKTKEIEDFKKSSMVFK